ncbi:CAP domain-containing protein [uncultured Clostridium sp.]|uniref:CAP domain-containing protein n=1 Tax=uncultured Clostridium sp. TaxID=59620 RepID=UPI00280AFC25|nr:CAP domain-containing protein [uncultured Clostridium sp.]
MRKRKITKAIISGIALSLVLSFMPVNKVQGADSTFVHVYPDERTFEQINEYFATHPFDTNMKDEYDIVPDIGNKAINDQIKAGTINIKTDKDKREQLIGKLSDKTIDNALNAINSVRYVAGAREMKIDEEKMMVAQAGAALSDYLGVTTHYLPKDKALAAGIAEPVFNLANQGTNSSNIVQGGGVAGKIVNSFMPDPGNDGTGLGHRKLILTTANRTTGFGASRYSQNPNVLQYAMGNYLPEHTGVMWPARKQPVDIFNTNSSQNPWSFVVLSQIKVKESELKVTLECNGEIEEILPGQKVGNLGKLLYKNGMIIFRPAKQYNPGDKVKVTIEGIYENNNQDIKAPATYDVHFFEIGTVPYSNITVNSATRSDETNASISLTSDGAGVLKYLIVNEGDSEPTIDEILNGEEVLLSEGDNSLNLDSLQGDSAKKIYYVTLSSTGINKPSSEVTASGELSSIKALDIAEYEPIIYDILEGKEGEVYKGDDAGYKVRCIGEFHKFTDILIDGQLVDKNNYTAVSGSTIVTLNKDYIATLSLGKHDITFKFTDGEGSTFFNVLERKENAGGGTDTDKEENAGGGSNIDKEENAGDGTNTDKEENAGGGTNSNVSQNTTNSESSNKVNTDDANNAILWIILAISAASTLGILLVAKRRKSFS